MGPVSATGEWQTILVLAYFGPSETKRRRKEIHNLKSGLKYKKQIVQNHKMQLSRLKKKQLTLTEQLKQRK